MAGDDHFPDDPESKGHTTAMQDTTLWAVDQTQTYVATPDAALVKGQAIGRYVVLDRIGQGGMGVVYAAYDPELDRKVALKLLRSQERGSEGDADRRARLLREAQAMARLSHPNVVIVHDAGVIDDLVFVAMEFLDGGTLRQWLRDTPRSWQEKLRVLIAAGRGLAQAHAAGLVHRDFKPDNVLLGQEGRIRVADFGLARFSEHESLESSVHPVKVPSNEHAPLMTPRVPTGELTVAGTVLGTPAYMAPEQHLGHRADARSDQFSFCVTLFEAMYGTVPFAGRTAKEILEEIVSGRIQEPPSGSDVPGSVREAIRRGLRAIPDERYPTMEVLLADLSPALRKRRPKLLLLAAAAALVCAVTIAVVLSGRTKLCTGGQAKLSTAWSDTSKRAVKRAFSATGAPFAAPVWRSVERILDDYGQRWKRSFREACEATRVRGEQTEALLERKMRCLNRSLADLRAQVNLFAQADRTVVTRAVRVVQESSSGLALCADAEALSAEVPPPTDPDLRAKVDAAFANLADLRARARLGRYAAALKPARVLVRKARTLGYLPLIAQALRTLGRLEYHSGRYQAARVSLDAAVFSAIRGKNDREAIRALLFLTSLQARDLGKPGEAERSLRLARALLPRIGSARALDALGYRMEGMLRAAQGRIKDAVASTLRSLKIRELAGFGADVEASALYNNLGSFYAQLGKLSEAERALTRSVKIRETHLGPDHPLVGDGWGNLGFVRVAQGRLKDGLSLHRRAAGISEKVLGLDHPHTALAWVAVADGFQRLGDYREAVKRYRRALKVLVKKYGRKHKMVLGARNNLASALAKLQRNDEALRILREILTQQVETLGPGHPDVGVTYHNLGELYQSKGAWRTAADHFRRSLAILERKLGGKNVELVDTLSRLGEVWLALGQRGKALPHLERAYAIARSQRAPAGVRAPAAFALARGVTSAARGKALGEEALRLARKAGPTTAPLRRRIERWLAARRKGAR